MTEPKDIISQLRRIRQDQNCSQDALSALTGMNARGHLCALENGRREPRLDTLITWADALGYDVVLKAKE